MSAIILQNELVHYEVLGRGRPVIFLHTWVGSWRYWIPAMQTVSVTFRAYALDFWGYGDTAKQSTRYLIGQQVALLEDFLEEMGICNMTLIGHGMGAVVGLIYTSLHADQVDRLMAVSLPVQASQVADRLRRDSPSTLAEWLLSPLPGSEAVRVEAPKADPLAIIYFLNDLEFLDLDEIIQHSKNLFLFVYGQNDPAVTMPERTSLAKLPQTAHFIEFEDCGHFPMLERTEKFNRLLTDFYSLASGESPRKLQIKEPWKRRMR